jgi:hypothetical protein
MESDIPQTVADVYECTQMAYAELSSDLDAHEQAINALTARLSHLEQLMIQVLAQTRDLRP